ncbi:hypothetical protein LshimejAT787_0903820 [Lyophyllum shimeji]|uniref:Uncharacterized protein n=1 Tax=Lyophyllum shimeji TaxID=47721 RepID=A0A9P3PR41_LYOSH|nr:hypothetical protein LshimejAT787_0903820 [Lyophyllum shimeji]
MIMAQPAQNFPLDTKIDSPAPPPPTPTLHTQLSPPAYGSSSYPQAGLPQPSQFSAMHPHGLQQQQLPRGAMSPRQPQVPLGTLTPQATMGGGLPPLQQVPLGTYPAQQVPLGAFSPQQVPLGMYPAQQVHVPMGTYPVQQVQMGAPLAAPPMATQAQIGQQYQAAQFAQCAYGNHARTTKYGVVGIIGAITDAVDSGRYSSPSDSSASSLISKTSARDVDRGYDAFGRFSVCWIFRCTTGRWQRKRSGLINHDARLKQLPSCLLRSSDDPRGMFERSSLIW